MSERPGRFDDIVPEGLVPPTGFEPVVFHLERVAS